MKFFALTVLSTVLLHSVCIAADHIIFRTGQEADVKLYQITDKTISFGYVGNNSGTTNEVSSSEVYMIYRLTCKTLCLAKYKR